MPEEESWSVEEITKRLDVLIYLFLKQNQEKGVTTRQTIKELNDIGLKDFEIAKILGRSRSYIASELTQLRKSSKAPEESVQNE